MTYKTITAAEPGGYMLNTTNFTGLSITGTGSVGGTGVDIPTAAQVDNSGSINVAEQVFDYVYGVQFAKGGNAYNTGFISGYDGIVADAGAAQSYIANKGFISGYLFGVDLRSGGHVTNTASGTITASDALAPRMGAAVAVSGGSASVANYGTLTSAYGTGVAIGTGTIANGSVRYEGALILAVTGISTSGVATVSNFGKIAPVSFEIPVIYGVLLNDGGVLTNGASNDTAAVIEAYHAVEVVGASVSNFATIMGYTFGASGVGSGGVFLSGGSRLTNGSQLDRTALIEGYSAVKVDGTSSVANFATILGQATIAPAAYIRGGALTNGTAFDTTALVQGYRAVVVTAGGTVTNFATIDSTGVAAAAYTIGAYGVLFTAGGQLVNGSSTSHAALIEGYGGVEIQSVAGSVFNFATIEAIGYAFGAAALHGQVTNGGATDQTALIRGATGVSAATVNNFGVITGAGANGAGVSAPLAGPMDVTNGSGGDKNALITGAYGVDAAGGGAVVNYATITGSAHDGVLIDGGEVTNGGGTDRAALIQGANGVYVRAAAGGVVNFGTVDGDGGANSCAINLAAGGEVTNGGGGDEAATLIGATGVFLGAAGTVANFATIDGVGRYGVVLLGAGGVTNGGGGDHAALIEGYDGVVAGVAGDAIRNSGSIVGTGGEYTYGVILESTDTLTNGSKNNGVALIAGYTGVILDGAGAATNFGTILGDGDTGGAGVVLDATSSLVNGAAGHTGALVEGLTGVSTAYGSASLVTNYGTIAGTGGNAVYFNSSADVLAVEAGSTFVGAVGGGQGTLDLASGVGTLSGLLSAQGNVTVSGSMATTTFTDFGTLEVGPGASFTTAGGTISASQALDIAGTLTTAGTLSVAGALTTSGTLAGTGVLALTGGKANFATGTSLTIGKVTESGASLATVADASLTYAGVWAQTAGAISVSAGDKVTFTGTGNSFAGTLAGAGIVALTAGSDTLSGTTLSVTSMDIYTATTLSGTITGAGAIYVTTPSIVVAAAGATLTGGSGFYLSSTATNEIEGAGAAATLTNVSDKIDGAGLLGGGQMVLINDAAGLIAGNQALGLTINTGTSTITNAGVIEDTGAGGTTIVSNLDNTGTLQCLIGTLTVEGTVTGAGVIHIVSGAADFTSTTAALAENVTFTGTTGVLELANSQHFTGTVSGFSKTGTTSLDLRDITFTSGTTKATYSGTTTSGILTVTSGSEVAHITLEGNYTTSTFTPSSDGNGGTTVVDPPAPAAGAPGHIAPIQPLIAAMADFGIAGGAGTHTADTWRTSSPILAAPGMHSITAVA